MAKITQVTQGLQGLLARQNINAALKSVEVDSTINGDGNIGTPLSISSSLATKLNQIDNVRVINSKSDLPSPSGGVITLEAGINYIPGGPINLGTDRLDVSANQIGWIGFNSLGSLLTYTGTGTLFTGVDAGFRIANARIDCPNGQVFDFRDVAAPGTNIFSMDTVEIQRCAKFGTLNNLISLIISNSSATDADDGLSLLGNGWTVHSIERFALLSSSATFKGIDYGTSVAQDIHIRNYIASGPTGAVGITGAANSANIPVGGIGKIVDCSFLGDITPTTNILSSDIRWTIRSTTDLQDTIPDVLLSLNNNTTETTITDTSIPVKVAGTWVEERASHFSTDASGRVTYIGERPLVFPIDMIFTVEPSSGTNKVISGFIAKNGSPITTSRNFSRVDATDPKSFSVIGQTLLNPGEYIETFVLNETDLTSVIVSTCRHRER